MPYVARSTKNSPFQSKSHDYSSSKCLSVNLKNTGKLSEGTSGGFQGDEETPIREFEMCRKLALETGCRVFFPQTPDHRYPERWRHILGLTEAARADGARIIPGVSGRPISLLASSSMASKTHYSRAKILDTLPCPPTIPAGKVIRLSSVGRAGGC